MISFVQWYFSNNNVYTMISLQWYLYNDIFHTIISSLRIYPYIFLCNVIILSLTYLLYHLWCFTNASVCSNIRRFWSINSTLLCKLSILSIFPIFSFTSPFNFCFSSNNCSKLPWMSLFNWSFMLLFNWWIVVILSSTLGHLLLVLLELLCSISWIDLANWLEYWLDSSSLVLWCCLALFSSCLCVDCDISSGFLIGRFWCGDDFW